MTSEKEHLHSYSVLVVWKGIAISNTYMERLMQIPLKPTG